MELSPGPAFGLAMMAHRRPSQCRTSVLAGPPGERDSPTAQASEAERATTAFRKLSPEGRSGLGTVRHFPPCHRSTSVLAGRPERRATPTAHTSPAEATETPSSSLDSRARSAGPVSTCQPPWQAGTGPASSAQHGSSAASARQPQLHRRLQLAITGRLQAPQVR